MLFKQIFAPTQAKWIVSALLIVLLSSCTTVPVEIKFPEAPAELLAPCPELAQADVLDPRLSSLLTVVTANYARYYDCKSQNDGWQRWYQDQRRIFNQVFDK